MRPAVLAVVLAGGALLSALGARATAPAGRYTIANGLVVDNATKLTWQQAAPTNTTFTAAQAKSFCPILTSTFGGTGWRLPNVKELASLLDRSLAAGPMLDATAFPGSPNNAYWSSTPDAAAPTMTGWTVDFSNGRITRAPLTSSVSVRCVR
jgi:hypothetical protein